MKKFTLLFMLLCSMVNYAQDSKINKSFRTKTSVVVYAYDPKSGKPDKSIHFLLNDDIKFYVYKVKDSGYVISVWDFSETFKTKKNGWVNKKDFFKSLILNNKLLDTIYPDKSEYYKMSKNNVGIIADTIENEKSPFKNYSQLAYVDYWGNNMQFFMPLKDFDENCESIYPTTRSFTWGFLTLPIKMRFKNSKAPFTFEEKINFGLAFGCKFQRPTTTYSAHNLLAGVSISNVKLTEDSSAAALSISGGYMYQYNVFQIGAFVGFDYIGGSQSEQFSFQGKPWLGLAIGISLFGENKTSAETSKSTNTNK